MRWIDRGLEPGGVREYARKFTQGWVEYFSDRVRIEVRPNDSHWRDFRYALGDRSGGNCWYCERRCMRDADDGGKAPTVDHFRPLNRFPKLAYRWFNWVFSCRRCNDSKGGEWPDLGYVDPGAADEEDRPERFFDYDAATGEIIPMHGLAPKARKRAQRTIDDLGLNKLDVLSLRRDWIRAFLEDWQAFPIEEQLAFAEFSARTGGEFAGATLMAIRHYSLDR